MSGRLLTLVEVLAWWAACLGVWLISVSAVSTGELVVATVVSLACGCAAVAGRRATRGRWHIAPASLRPAALLPMAVISDAAQVLVAPLRRRRPVHGQFPRFELPGGVGDGPAAAGRRASATWLVSVTPGTFVADAEPQRGAVLLHKLSSRGPRMEEAVRR